MKKILLSMFLLGAILSANAQVPSYVPKDSLKGWWPFNGNANDESGNGYTYSGTINSLTNDRFGNSRKAIDLTNQTNYITTNYYGVMGQNPRTVNLWFKVLSTAGPFPDLFTYGSGSGGGWNMRLVKLHPTIENSNSQVQYNPTIDTLRWHMFTVTYDVAFGTNTLACKLYIDGKRLTTINSNYNGSQTLNTTKGNPIVFGISGATNVVMDDVGMWSRVLTQQELDNLFNACHLSISTEPTNQSSNINGQVQFNALASDTTASYQWQSNQSNLGWVNIPSSSFYSGVTSKKLTVNNIQLNNHKQLFRVIATKNTCKDTSVVAMLTVNDTCITSTTDTLYIKVNTSSLSNPIYNTVKVYPNPSSTQVIIDNGNFSTMVSYTAKIVNSIGQQVFQSIINQQQFVIDAKTMGGAGVYTLYITDANNKVVGVKKIVLQ